MPRRWRRSGRSVSPRRACRPCSCRRSTCCCSRTTTTLTPISRPSARSPPLGVLPLSRNHYDHLDLSTIEARAGKDRVEVVVPLGLAGYFKERGYGRVHELDWYGEQTLAGLAITALPAIHFSKRTPLDRNRTLWTGYAIQGRGKRVYFAGDTAYGPVFQEIGRRIAP